MVTSCTREWGYQDLAAAVPRQKAVEEREESVFGKMESHF